MHLLKYVAVMLIVTALAIALVHQHYFGAMPCAWCVFQRLVYMLIALWFIVAIVLPKYAKFMYKLAIATNIIGVWSVYHHIKESKSTFCDFSVAQQIMDFTKLAKILPQVFKTYSFCNEANLVFLNIPYAFWSAILFSVLTIISVVCYKNAYAKI